nr:hypothetical protein [uncultured Butyrivibrio sp.]
MKVMKSIGHVAATLSAVAALSLTSLSPIMPYMATTVYAADTTVYKVSGQYSGNKIFKVKDSITLDQEYFRKNLRADVYYVVNQELSSIHFTTGGGDADNGTISKAQLAVFKSREWETYVANTNSVSQAEALAAYPSITINEDNFKSAAATGASDTLGSSVTVPLTVAVFTKAGDLYGTFSFTILAEREGKTETVINGESFETILSRVIALQENVAKFETTQTGYENIHSAINAAVKDMDATSISDAVTKIEGKIAELEADTDNDHTAEIENLNSTIGTLKELQAAGAELTANDTNIRSTLNSLIEEYDTVYNELRLLDEVSSSKNVGYAGEQNGKPVVYINGSAFPYDKSSGTEIEFFDENGGKHSAVKYTASNNGVSFDFYVTLSGIHVINADGTTTVFEDTLEQTLIKVSAMLSEISSQLTDYQKDVSSFTKDLADILGEDLSGTDAEKLAKIKESVTGLVTGYNDIKDDYVALIQALRGELTEEEIKKIDSKDVLSQMDELKNKAQSMSDEIQKAITGTAVNDANREKFEDLLSNIQNLVATLDTKKTEVDTLMAALGTDNVAEAITTAKNLVSKVEQLEAEKAALEKANKTKTPASTKTPAKVDTSAYDKQIKALQEQIKSLNNTNSSLKNQVANTSNSSKTNTSTANATNEKDKKTIAELENKVAALTDQLANSKKSSTTSNTSKNTTTNNKTGKESTAVVTDVSDSATTSSSIDEQTKGKAVVLNGSDTKSKIDDSFNLNGREEESDSATLEASTETQETDAVVEEKSSGNAKGIVSLVFLLSALLGGGGYAGYRFLLKKPGKNNDIDELLEDDYENEDMEGFDDDEDSEYEDEPSQEDEVEIDDSDDFEEEDFDESFGEDDFEEISA